ncbi:hypothetical protein GH733_019515 [Mirounga leonina]|nr:hypothetical protein GH733_019515 [Mirounga leonina]
MHRTPPSTNTPLTRLSRPHLTRGRTARTRSTTSRLRIARSPALPPFTQAMPASSQASTASSPRSPTTATPNPLPFHLGKPGKPQHTGTSPRRAQQASAAGASRLPLWRAGLPAPSRGRPWLTRMRPPGGTVRFRVTRRGRQRLDDRLARPGQETTRAAESGQSARPASGLSRHRRGPAPGTAHR